MMSYEKALALTKGVLGDGESNPAFLSEECLETICKALEYAITSKEYAWHYDEDIELDEEDWDIINSFPTGINGYNVMLEKQIVIYTADGTYEMGELGYDKFMPRTADEPRGLFIRIRTNEGVYDEYLPADWVKAWRWLEPLESEETK